MWIQRVSWIGLLLALAGFVAGLGIHLATFAGINARLYLPEIMSFGRLLYIPIFVVSFIAFLFRERSVRGVTPLPEWVRTTVIILLAVVMLYAMINLAINGWLWAPFPDAEDQLRQFRTDSSLSMMVFFVMAVVIADYGLGLLRYKKPAQLVSR